MQREDKQYNIVICIISYIFFFCNPPPLGSLVQIINSDNNS
jgi:hypothetical protein